MVHNNVPICPDAGEQLKRFLDSVLTNVLAEDEVVAAAGRHKDDRRHIVEALNPLAAFISLSSDVKHAVHTGSTMNASLSLSLSLSLSPV